MEQTTKTGSRTRVTTIVVALLAGFVVLLLVFPASGIEPIPPVCYSMLGYVVPCDAWVAWAAGAATAALVGLVLWTNDRRRQ